MPINDKISRDLIDVEPTAILEFYQLYANTAERPDDCFYFHPCSLGLTQQIVLNGKSYLPVAVEVEDFETNIFNRIVRPRIRVGNQGLVISDILLKNNDFKYAKIVRKKIFIKYVDDVNFDGGVNPFGIADPNAEISSETFVISQKLQENKNFVEFELTAPFDLENFNIPGRLVLGRYCYWQYRGVGCNYFGRPVCQENDQQFTYIPTGNAPLTGAAFDYNTLNLEWQDATTYQPGSIAFVITTKDPFVTFYVCKQQHVSSVNNHPSLDASPWEKDGCSKLISACRKRFINTGIHYTGKAPNDVTGQATASNIVPQSLAGENKSSNFYLPFGGFPATDNYSYGASFRNRT
jgi:lambda family phage minor tail protein L